MSFSYVVDDEMLNSMAQSIVRQVAPEQIILFGSRANGNEAPHSDVDLLVVEKEPFGKHRSRRAELRKIRQALSPFHIPKDILVFSMDEVNHWKSSVNHIIGHACREGRIIYG